MFELCPVLQQSFNDGNGDPLAGGFLYSYAAGTTTPLATYTDSTGATPNTNPIVLDSKGRASVWIGESSYKFVLTDSMGNIQWSTDDVLSVAAQIAAVGVQQFNQVNVNYSQIQAASMSNPIALFTLPAGYILGRIVIKHSQAFTGGGITDVYAQVGISGNYGAFIEHLDIFQTPADNAFDNTLANYIASWANSSVIYLNAVSAGANLSALTQGALTVYYELVNLLATG